MKSNKKGKLFFTVFMLVLSLVMFVIILFNMFGFNTWIASEDLTEDTIKLYGGIFFALSTIIWIFNIRRGISEDDIVCIKSLERYANTTEDSKTTIKKLIKTWEKGIQIRDWCRMDKYYIIVFLNGPSYANVIPIEEIVWAYKTGSKLHGVIHTSSGLLVKYNNQKGDFIQLSEQIVDVILQQLFIHHLDIALGYSREIEKLYIKKDMNGIKTYAHQQRKKNL